MTEELATLKDMLGDRFWRLNNLYRIKDKHGQEVTFRMNESQMQFYEDMWWLNIILKDRQRGFSTEVAMLILDTCLFYPNTACGIIDITLPDAKKKLDKISFAYTGLPQQIQDTIKVITDNKESIEWDNGSRVDVSTSHRGGTLQILHISEYGKISARKPDVAKEIKTGAFNTVAPGNIIIVESTAEGQEGEFYEICQKSQAIAAAKTPLTNLDFKFHFFAWWMGAENELDANVPISAEMEKYFAGIEHEMGIKINDRKRAWYVKKAEQQGDSMKREYPSTPREAFEQAIDGSYYASQMMRMRKDGRICRVPYDEGFPVYTFWDLGMDDSMTITFRQIIGMQNRIIDYEEASGEGLAYYAKVLHEKGYHYSNHYMPHDARVRELGTGIKRVDKAIELGIKPVVIVDRPRDLDAVLDGIEAVRTFLSTCWIDEVKCAGLIKCLDGYRKEWDDKAGVFKRGPLHNWASHGADSVRTGAMAVRNEAALVPESKVIRRERRDWFC